MIPFSAVPLGFSVMGTRTLWWGGCAWDSFALPQLLPDQGEVLVATRCPACGRPHAWNVGSRRPPDGDQVAHFLVPAPRMWEDVVHTCRNQRLFCSEACVDAWLAATGTIAATRVRRLAEPAPQARWVCHGLALGALMLAILAASALVPAFAVAGI